MQLKNIFLQKEKGMAIVTIERPPLNLLNSQTLLELKKVWEDLEKDNSKVVILTGVGKAFVAGADIKEMKDKDPSQANEFAKLGQAIFNRIEDLEKPVICAVNGLALGGGLELVMSCDIIIASEEAKFGQPEVGLGLIPGWGATQKLPRIIGRNMAKELILTGEVIDANEALRIGLVSKVVKSEDLMEETKKLAGKIISKAPIPLRLAKSLINKSFDINLKEGLSLESKAFGLCFSTKDRKEGMNAFMEKREPKFRNE